MARRRYNHPANCHNSLVPKPMPWGVCVACVEPGVTGELDGVFRIPEGGLRLPSGAVGGETRSGSLLPNIPRRGSLLHARSDFSARRNPRKSGSNCP